MESLKTNTNQSFNHLSKNAKFLNAIIHNLCCCILLLDNKMQLQAYNDPFKSIFSNKKDEDLLYYRCGKALGCAYSVDEKKRCGETQHCKYCKLRESALLSYTTKMPVYKENISREFYTTKETKELKHLQFSTRLFIHEKESYIILMIEDITKTVKKEEKIIQQAELINQLTQNMNGTN